MHRWYWCWYIHEVTQTRRILPWMVDPELPCEMDLRAQDMVVALPKRLMLELSFPAPVSRIARAWMVTFMA